jgi:ABC-2 type transport system permease protein
MAVYKRTYKAYEGALTPPWSRFLILPRSAYGRLMQTKFLLIYLVACFFFPLGCVAFIYGSHNLSFLSALNIPAGPQLKVNAAFFQYFCSFQGSMAVLLTSFVGPGLVAPDLANNALPLYFCRPFTRFQYVFGKMSLLLALLSAITWVPGLVLFVIQSSLAGSDWARDNSWIATSIFTGLLIWDLVLCLIALAISALVKWRIAAGGAILAIFFAGAGFGTAVNSIVRTQYGSLFDLRKVIGLVFSELFRETVAPDAVPVSDAWTALALACAVCLWLLSKRIRPFEVVR